MTILGNINVYGGGCILRRGFIGGKDPETRCDCADKVNLLPRTTKRVFEGYPQETGYVEAHFLSGDPDDRAGGGSFGDEWFAGLEGKRVRITIEEIPE